MSLMSIRVQGTCHRRAWDGWQPAHGSPLSHVFFRNLQRRQARSFRISLACFLCSGRSGPRRRPTFFSPATLSLPVEFFRMTELVVGVVMGLLRGPDDRLAGGEAEEPEPEPEPLAGLGRLDGDDMMGMGGTAAAGQTSTCEWCWWFSPGKQYRWLAAGSAYVSDSGEKGE